MTDPSLATVSQMYIKRRHLYIVYIYRLDFVPKYRRACQKKYILPDNSTYGGKTTVTDALQTRKETVYIKPPCTTCRQKNAQNSADPKYR